MVLSKKGKTKEATTELKPVLALDASFPRGGGGSQ